MHAFTVFGCAVLAGFAAAISACAGLKGRGLLVFACAVVATSAVLLAGARGIASTNDLSSYNLARAVAEVRSFQLDHWVRRGSIDISFYDDHYYSDRPPLTGWLAAIPYAAISLANDGAAFPPDLENGVLLVPMLATLCTMVALLRMSVRLGSSEDAALLAVLVFAFASPAFVYGRVLFVHALSAALVAGGCLQLLERARLGRLLAAGLLFGFSVIADYSNGILVAIAAAWLVLRRGRELPRMHAIAAFVAGLVVPACLLMAYNDTCFGSPFTLSYSYCKFAWARTFSGTFSGPFLAGFLGLSVRPPTGIFVWSPIAAAAIPGLLMLVPRERREDGLLLLVLFGGMLLLTSRHRTWYGGGTYDARYLSSVFPLLLTGLAVTVSRLMSSGSRVLRAVIWILVIGSMALRWIWATRFVGYVDYAPTPLVPAIMAAAITIWFVAGLRASPARGSLAPAVGV